MQATDTSSRKKKVPETREKNKMAMMVIKNNT